MHIRSSKYQTPFQELNRLISINEGNLVLVCGQSKVGKSILLHDLALHYAALNLKVMFISLQKSPNELISYFLTSTAGVHQVIAYEIVANGDTANISDMNISHDDMERIYYAMNKLKALPINIVRKYDINHIEATVSAAIEKNNVDVVIIDSLSLIHNPELTSLYEKNKNITQRLKKLAAENDIPIIISGNVNSEIKTRLDKRPIYIDIPFSIEYDFDIIISLYRDELILQEDSKDRGTTEIGILKNNGPLGIVKIAFLEPILKYMDLKYYWDLEETL